MLLKSMPLKSVLLKNVLLNNMPRVRGDDKLKIRCPHVFPV